MANTRAPSAFLDGVVDVWALGWDGAGGGGGGAAFGCSGCFGAEGGGGGAAATGAAVGAPVVPESSVALKLENAATSFLFFTTMHNN